MSNGINIFDLETGLQRTATVFNRRHFHRIHHRLNATEILNADRREIFREFFYRQKTRLFKTKRQSETFCETPLQPRKLRRFARQCNRTDIFAK